MPISQYANQSALSVSNTELSLISGTSSLQNDTTDGVYQLWIDPLAMLKGDEFLIRIYEKVISGSTKRVVFSATLSDAQSENFVTPMLILMHGWDMTIIRVAGSDRTFDASIRQIA